ncbi:MAG: hypothetical protein JWN25_1801 [Verrucomicrobiales bacterium]|nr:hypothetical protein [Verrucomicrobiales bacterium]
MSTAQTAPAKQPAWGVWFLVIMVLWGIGSLLPDRKPTTGLDDPNTSYSAGSMAGELEARLAYNSGRSFPYPVDRQEALAFANQKISGAGAFASPQARQKWLEGFADGLKSFMDNKATELHRIR